MAHAEHRLTLPARTDSDADPAVAAVLAKAKAQVGMIPNMYARMANVPGLLDAYLNGYSAFRSESGFTPAEQEVILLTISRVNGCTYCMAAHSTIADNAFLAAGYTESDILQILLAVSVKTISNYANHLFHTPVDGMFAHRVWTE
jgi:AhpD family alkylhydroperoxidase